MFPSGDQQRRSTRFARAPGLVSSNRRRRIGIYALAFALAVWTLIPILWLARLSLTEPIELIRNPFGLWPRGLTVEPYLRVLDLRIGPFHSDAPPSPSAALLRHGFINSGLVATVVTFFTLIITVPAAYGVARVPSRGKPALLLALMVARAYPPIALVIPYFLYFSQHGLLGTRRGLAVTHFAMTAPLAMWVLVAYFSSLPATLEAAARVDGNTRWQAFYRVILPNAWPSIAVTAAISFVACWNEFTLAQFLTAGSSAHTFAPASVPLLAGTPHEIAAAMLIAILPAALGIFVFQCRIRSLNLVSPL